MTTERPFLNCSQARAVSSDEPNILCVASPGAGKTRVLVERMARLMRGGTRPAELICVTYTRAAAAEMVRRLAAEFGYAVELGYAGTLHGLCLRLVQEWGRAVGYGPRLTVLDAEQADQLLEQSMAEVGCRSSKTAVKEAIEKNRYTDIRNLPTPAQVAANRFRQNLMAGGCLTFDLLLSEALRVIVDLVQPHLSRPWPYRHLMVDEAQDSAKIDFEIYEALPCANKFIVGDGDQQIFSFRGADASMLLRLNAHPDWTTIALQENYRSDRAICRAANALIRRNQERIAKEIWPVSEKEGEVVCMPCKTSDGEKVFVSGGIRSVTQHGKSVAVLLRYNQHVEEWTRYLESVGIPVVRRQRQARPADWAFCRQTLALLNDPENDLLAYWFVRAKHGPAKADKSRLEAQANGDSLNAYGLHIPADLPIAAYGPILARCGVSAESVALVEQAVAEQPDLTGSDLLLALAQEEEAEQETGEGVIVSTIHGFKGRESAAIFVPCFEDEIIPGRCKREEELAEARRLAFVAVTRARHYLCLSYAQERRPMYGPPAPQPATPSRFLSEMGVL